MIFFFKYFNMSLFLLTFLTVSLLILILEVDYLELNGQTNCFIHGSYAYT